LRQNELLSFLGRKENLQPCLLVKNPVEAKFESLYFGQLFKKTLKNLACLFSSQKYSCKKIQSKSFIPKI